MRPSAVLLVASTLLLPVPAGAEVTVDEAVCETKASLATWKYVAAKTGCLVSCQRGVRKGTTDPADCVAPYPPSPTFGCIQGKEGRANGRICSGCNPDAPECYPEICPDTTNVLLTTVDLPFFGAFLPAIYCDDGGSDDGLTSLEGRCQDTIAKYVVKYGYYYARCYAKCRLSEVKGIVAAGSCVPPATDPATQACVAKLDLAVPPRIDRYCQPPYGDAPECNGDPSGTLWTALMGYVVDGFDPTFYCEN